MSTGNVPSVAAALVIAISAAPVHAAESPAHQLARLFDEAWEFEMREDPLFATDCGDHRFDDRLPSVTKDQMPALASMSAVWAQPKGAEFPTAVGAVLARAV